MRGTCGFSIPKHQSATSGFCCDQVSGVPCVHAVAHIQALGYKPEQLLPMRYSVAHYQSQLLETKFDLATSYITIPTQVFHRAQPIRIAPILLPRTGRPRKKGRLKSKRELMTPSAGKRKKRQRNRRRTKKIRRHAKK